VLITDDPEFREGCEFGFTNACKRNERGLFLRDFSRMVLVSVDL